VPIRSVGDSVYRDEFESVPVRHITVRNSYHMSKMPEEMPLAEWVARMAIEVKFDRQTAARRLHRAWFKLWVEFLSLEQVQYLASSLCGGVFHEAKGYDGILCIKLPCLCNHARARREIRFIRRYVLQTDGWSLE